MTRPILAVPVGFAPSAVDKVERLLEVLDAFRNDAYLRDAFVLHGGTALNLYYDDAPRLSVDIDLMYVAEPEVEAMRSARPEVDRRIRRVLEAAGYVVQATNSEHSGQTYRVKYPGDYIKIDLSYLARIPVLEPRVLSCALAEPGIEFLVLDERELTVGKVKAMMERLVARDLFDLYRLSTRMPGAFGDPLMRALAVRAITTADPFPFVTDPVQSLERCRGVANDFAEPLTAIFLMPSFPALVAGVANDFAEPLTAMLRPEDAVDLDQMLDSVGRWLSPLTLLTDIEIEYMRLLDEEAVYAPELILAQWPEVLQRAQFDPVMAWKVKNLAARPGKE